MEIKEPITDLPIGTANSGFYSGFIRSVTLPAKFIITALILWALAFPEGSGSILKTINSFILSNFATWYIWVVALFVLVCVVLAAWPPAGRLKLGLDSDKPEFSSFSWFSMMFGAGIGVGMLTWSVAEPMYHWNNNPEVIQGLVAGATQENIRNAYKWSFLHWGFSAWACYAIVGLSLAFFSYRRNLPLTIRSALTPLFGKSLSGTLGHIIDIVAVVATILGVAQTLGFGVEQFVAGVHRIGVGDWLLNDAGTASSAAIMFAIVVIMGASTLSALSGVGKGIKWLSNINMVLSILLLGFFIIFGATWFGLTAMFYGLIDYAVALPDLLFGVWGKDGTEVGDKLAGWQGSWSVFYWAWWVAFAPFVGLFLARISKGRSVREFVLGAMIIPSIMCFVWFTWAGGTAIDLELNGMANGVIAKVTDGDKIFAMVNYMVEPISSTFSWLMTVMIVVLLITYLVTTADSAILVINTINAAGDEGPKARLHIIFWGVALGLVVAALLLVGGLQAIKTAMVIGALPFSLVMVLMCISLVKAICRDGLRGKENMRTTPDTVD
ncbi:BCCT family transporter [Leucothrix arctica]|uniref:Transporter n=1 Tax=Leucothrix arctica TaxID=1481894 RepID=A0A317CK14_9GAMM|nr:BCCT family transporter [Leucothrix arctica]PWQ97783.1 transporter [Leucothrix arctica]